MKQLNLLLALLLSCFSINTKAQDHTNAFITIWDTQYMDNGTTLTIPSAGTNYQYYWEKVGSESTDNAGSYQTNSNTLSITGIAAKSGIYKVYIKGSTYQRIVMVSDNNAAKALTTVQSWGNITWTNMYGAFYGCTNLTALPAAAPKLTNVTNMQDMFRNCSSFNQSLNNWVVANVTNMSYMFYEATAFNGNISSWDVSKVINMSNMFYGCLNFNQDISSWNVSKVTSMAYMFYYAQAFNQDISNWNVATVANMSNMFGNCIAFNQDITGWAVGMVSDMSSMFYGASAFNQNLGNWTLNASVSINNMLDNAGLNSENYGRTLKGWADASGLYAPNSRNLGALKLKYRVEYQSYRDKLITPLAGSGKGWSITDAGPDATVLPVTLTTFAAKATGNHAKLQWQTFDEVNNKGFVIYRKDGGLEGEKVESSEFVKIGEVSATINHQPLTINYSFTDKNPLNGQNYYKLVQVDNDGKTTELGIKALSFGLPTTNIQLYPNPATDKLNIAFGIGKYQNLKLLDITGKVLQNHILTNAQNEIVLNVGNYPKGIYVVELIGGNGNHRVKILK